MIKKIFKISNFSGIILLTNSKLTIEKLFVILKYKPSTSKFHI